MGPMLGGRRAGQRLVTVVMSTIVKTLTVHAEAMPARALAFEMSATHSAGSWEASYDSATQRLGTGPTIAFVEGERTARCRFTAYTTLERFAIATQRQTAHVVAEIDSLSKGAEQGIEFDRKFFQRLRCS
jgi:hypothetical protein